MQKELGSQEQLKQLGILYLGLISGQLLIFILLFFFAKENFVPAIDGAEGDSSMAIIIAFCCLMAIGTSFFIFNKRKELGRQLEGSLSEKLTHYRLSFLTRAAMIEGANLLALFSYFFMESNYVFLALFVIGISAFFYIRPTADRIAEDYQLSSTEQSELRNALK